ncbi:hypothetical protein, partial [Burkholderia sp. Bp8963]|uniref:hypothetical protein n=1 Tax=Burkholderia sp. Bp8963 TaxID=2184547 RepID=UPI001C89FCCD
QRSQFLSFFIRQLHWRCMSASAHPDMITEAVIYSIYLRDVVLGAGIHLKEISSSQCTLPLPAKIDARLQIKPVSID